jgi:anaerobic selenocysteine-containing dehydrogenase
METRYRACPLCEAICGLEFRYENDKLKAIFGDQYDTFSRGHICPKGNAILDLENDPDRLTQPQKRIGNDWISATWEEAFTEIGGRFAQIQKQHGAHALAMYFGNPNVHHFSLMAYIPLFVRAFGSRNLFSASSVDQWPHQLVNWQMYGHQWLLPIPDLDHLDTLLILGANPVASNSSLMTAPDVTNRLKEIAKRGSLIVLDPRCGETAKIATNYHPIKPDGDAVFLIALLQQLQKIGPAKLAAYAGKLNGFDDAVMQVNMCSLEHFFAHTGMQVELVQQIAQTIYPATNAAVYGRMGVSTQRHGTLTQYLIQLCNIYLGQLDRVGGCLPNEAIFPITGAGTSKGSRGRWHSRVRGLPEVSGELPVAVLREEIQTPGEGQIRALLTVAGNPVLSTPNGAALDQAIANLDFQVAIDLYVNETTHHADWILPPASFLTEDHYDIFFNAFAIRRVARLSTPIEKVPDGALEQWQILEGIARATREARNETHVSFPLPREILSGGLARGASGITIEDLLAAPHGLDLGPMQPSLLRRLETASGKIECTPVFLLELLNAGVAEFSTAPPLNDGSLQLIGRRHVRSNNSWMHNAQRLIKGKPRHQLLMNPIDMHARSISNGSRVRVRSRVGQIIVEVFASDDMMIGVVSLPHGFGHGLEGVKLTLASQLTGASINDVTDELRLDHGTGNAAFSGTRVMVERID